MQGMLNQEEESAIHLLQFATVLRLREAAKAKMLNQG